TVTDVGSIALTDTSGGLQVASASTSLGNITLSAVGGDLTVTGATAGSGTVNLSTVTSGAVNLGNLSAFSLNVNAAAGVTDSSASEVFGPATFRAGTDIVLDHPDNNFSRVAVPAARNVILVDTH